MVRTTDVKALVIRMNPSTEEQQFSILSRYQEHRTRGIEDMRADDSSNFSAHWVVSWGESCQPPPEF